MNIDSRKLKPGEYVFGTLVSRDLYPSREFSSYASTNFDLLQFYRRLRKIKDLRELKAVLDEVECAVKPGLAGTLRFKNQKGEQFRIEVNEDSEDAAFANWSRTLAGVTLHVDYKYVIGMARDGRFFGFWDRQGGEGEGRFAFLRECPSAPPLAEITSALGIR